MKVLIACEFSGTVRDEFTKLGHDAWSCDLLESETKGNHIKGDVLDHLAENWDLMIAFPPCTYLTAAGIGWFNEERWGDKARQRKVLRQEAYEFFIDLMEADIPQICIENPVGFINSWYRKPDQIINPFQFGHPERKRTCLWLKNLPLLKPTNIVKPEEPSFCDSTTGKKRYFTDKQTPKADRWKIRSKTFSGIATAMATQWSNL